MKSLRPVAIVAICLLGQTTLVQAQDANAGEKVFRKCAACHKIGDGAKNSTGPVLNDVIGRPAASYEGYKYSKTLLAANAAGLVWDADTISTYITDPKAFMKDYLGDAKARPKMTFKLKREQDRRDVIAYLQQFSEPVEMNDGETEMQDGNAPMDGAEAGGQDDAALAPLDGKVCVRNADAHSFFFAAGAKQGERVTATLAPGEVLCAQASGDGWSGVVSVYESETSFEGCSRLVKTGTLEEMRTYADFDRCAWSSNTDG